MNILCARSKGTGPGYEDPLDAHLRQQHVNEWPKIEFLAVVLIIC